MATSRTLRTTLKCMCHSAHIFRCSYSSRATRRLLVDNGCNSPELCNPIQYCLACRNLSIPPDVKMSSKNTLRYSRGIVVFKNFSTANADVLPTNAAWWLKALNRSTQRCVFHRASYKDVGVALSVNRLIVSAPPCTWFVLNSKKKLCRCGWIIFNIIFSCLAFKGFTHVHALDH